jgi:aspartate kinase
MKVCKFGGSSLADADQVRKVCGIVTSDPDRRVVVLSAPGRRTPDDTKVTDLLIALAEAALAGEETEAALGAVVGRYREIAEGLGMDETVVAEIEGDLHGRLAADATHRDRFVDALKAAGEDNNARLVAAYLAGTGVEARYVSPREAGLLVSDEHGNARVLPESYARLRNLADAPGLVIFPGFFGYTPEGVLVTFARGGSDITGAILAAALRAEVYENFTDVDHVYAANPALVGEPAAMAELTYREMRELSYAGFNVFHEEALEPVYHAGVPVAIKNTNNPSAPGTRIALARDCPAEGPVTGIAAVGGFATIYVSKYLMNREVGFGRRLLGVLEDEGLSFEHTPSGIDNMSVILRRRGFEGEAEARVVERVRAELGVDDVQVEHDLALVMLVGECMSHVVGTAGRACTALARAGVNIEMINQGSTEVSMMFGVKEPDMQAAVQALYDEFFGPKA